MPLTPGQVLQGRYRIVNLLGQGGFGAVYQAWDTNLNVPCALKENLDSSAEAARQFAREASLLANLRHPHLPRVTDHFFLPGQGQYLVMDYVQGDDLQTWLDHTHQPLPEASVQVWAMQICEALAYLHAQQPPIVHRDIKPANIKITPQGQAILVDFGIAKIYDPSLKTTVGARAVTPGYSPIEQYGHGATDARTDLYALGATLYTVLTGHEPPESTERVAGTPLIPPRALNPALSANMERVILEAMEIQPAQRYAHAQELRNALTGQHRRASQPPPTIISTSPPSAPIATTSPPVWLWGLAGFALIAVIGLVALLSLNSGIWQEAQPPTTVAKPVQTSVPSNTTESVAGLASSLGTTPEPPTLVIVPELRDLDLETALTVLSHAGLSLGITRQATDATIPVGNIIEQNPRAGLTVEPVTSVDLVVSLGPATSPTEPPPPLISDPTTTPRPDPMPDAVVNTNGLKLRMGPDEQHEVIALYPRGTELKVRTKDPTGDWLEVQVASDDRVGWMMVKYLRLNRDPDTIPILAAVPPLPTTPINEPPPVEKGPADAPAITVATADQVALHSRLAAHNASVGSIAFAPDGRSLVSGGYDGLVKLWHISDGTLLQTMRGHRDRVTSVAFSPDGDAVLSGSFDRTMRLWRTSDGNALRTFQAQESVWGVAWGQGADGGRLASAGKSGIIRLWHFNGSPLHALRGHSNSVESLAFSSDGALLASASQDRSIRLWHTGDGSLARTLKSQAEVIGVAFSPDGALLASGGKDRLIRLWRVETGDLLRTFDPLPTAIWSVSFSPDGSLVASGSVDGTVRLWRASDSALLNTLPGHSDAIWSVVFAPDSSLLASGAEDGTIRLWRIP
jgi:serine/threonine protein kinase